jgi:hypothetical protein
MSAAAPLNFQIALEITKVPVQAVVLGFDPSAAIPIRREARYGHAVINSSMRRIRLRSLSLAGLFGR